MLTMAEDTDGVARAVAHGARGYVRKDASREELSATLVQVLNGRSRVASVPARRGDGQTEPPALSERELQVLSGMSRGRSNAEIGRELYLSEDTWASPTTTCCCCPPGAASDVLPARSTPRPS
jgi:DNA-binding NarL/FixJ family response regulator